MSIPVDYFADREGSLSSRRAWIEMSARLTWKDADASLSSRRAWIEITPRRAWSVHGLSLSSRRAWIEIEIPEIVERGEVVALLTESVD